MVSLQSKVNKLSDLTISNLVEKEDGCEKVNNLVAQSDQIAIIGMAGKCGQADNLDELWKMLVDGRESIRMIPEQRKKDVEDYISYINKDIQVDNLQYIKASYLTDIAGFDYKFFGLSMQEAIYMDPNQRMLLETIWKALEDAGHSDKKIRKSNTGVYVGFSNDFGVDYRNMVAKIADESAEVAVSGNIKSIIASRISYLLDLHGPSIMIDTACSSGLVAMHQAVQALRRKECNMAIVGSVSCLPVPVTEDGKIGAGIVDIQNISTEEHHNRTFDDECQGTYYAEGAFAYILKPLEQAKSDGDNIRAIIRGSAVNQDGASNGITSPSVEAQKQLILNAIKDAKICAEDIGYIEAHGTATKLGDPIEIDGITRAFQQLTKRQQFCAIGTLKSNVGHLDNASGLGGVAKVILSMENGLLPGSLNFNIPNRNINFIDSPIYVNSCNSSWEFNSSGRYIAGVNSFGISGTNCHMIIESAPMRENRREVSVEEPYILPISAINVETLRALAEEYLKFVLNNDVDLNDLVYTASTGRKHHNARLAIIFSEKEELCMKLEKYLYESSEVSKDEKILTGVHRIIDNFKKKNSSVEITTSELEAAETKMMDLIHHKNDYTPETYYRNIAELYIVGADIPWEKLFVGRVKRVITLPTYPFQHHTCWVDYASKEKQRRKQQSHVLLGEKQYETMGYALFCFPMNCKSLWELREHKVNSKCVLPGTGLIQRMIAYMTSSTDKESMQFRNVVFHTPFAVEVQEERVLQMQLIEEEQVDRVRFVSFNDENEWVLHAEGEIVKTSTNNMHKPSKLALKEIESKLTNQAMLNDGADEQRGIVIGERWMNLITKAMSNVDNTEFLIELDLPEQYQDDLKSFSFHTALMDIAVNAANNVIDNEMMYLPLQYEEINVYNKVPGKVYSYIKRISYDATSMIQGFDIKVCDTDGNVVFEANKYHIKATSANSDMGNETFDYVRTTMKKIEEVGSFEESGKRVLVAGRTSEYTSKVIEQLQQKQYMVELVSLEEQDWQNKLANLENEQFEICIFEWASDDCSCLSEKYVSETKNDYILQAFMFIKKFHDYKIKVNKGLVCLVKQSVSEMGNEQEVCAEQAAIVGLWRTARLEYELSNMRCIDYEGISQIDVLVREIFNEERPDFVVYRNESPYIVDLENYSLKLMQDKSMLDSNGVYVITGGTGDLGLEIADHLYKLGVKHLALLGKSYLPPRDQWLEQIKNGDTDSKQINKMKKLIELEGKYESLTVKQTAIEDYNAINQLLEELRNEVGTIKGIMHLAGVAGDGYILNKDVETFRNVYEPKANGIANLYFSTINDKLDFFICFSSAASISYSVGQTDYTSANMYMDAFVEYMRMKGVLAVSIQWPAWSETGIAFRMGAVDETEIILPVKTGQALRRLEMILMHRHEMPSVVMPGKLEKRKSNLSLDTHEDNQYAEVNLLGVENIDNVYITVGNIWAGTLGVSEIDVDEEFHDLGGNSLLISQMLRKFQDKYPNVMSIIDIFTYNTINKQVKYIKKQLNIEEKVAVNDNLNKSFDKSKDLNDIDSILDSVLKGELSIEESYKLLEK